MIRICENAYVSDGMSGKVSNIKWKLALGIGMINTFFITLSSNESDVFDIYSAVLFKQKRFRGKNLHIIGIAKNEADARELIMKMFDDLYSKKGSYDNAREYFVNYFSL